MELISDAFYKKYGGGCKCDAGLTSKRHFLGPVFQALLLEVPHFKKVFEAHFFRIHLFHISKNGAFPASQEEANSKSLPIASAHVRKSFKFSFRQYKNHCNERQKRERRKYCRSQCEIVSKFLKVCTLKVQLH